MLIQLVDGVQRGREANPAVPRVRRRNEHVVRQLALHSDVPCKNVGRDSILLEIERIDAGPGTESRAERNGSRKRKYATVPGPESRGGVTRRVALEGAIQQIAVVHGYLVRAVLISAAVQEVLSKTSLDHRLVVQSVGETNPRTEVIPVNRRPVHSGAACTIPELSHRAWKPVGGRVRFRRVEIHHQVVDLGKRHHHVPPQAHVDRNVR